MPSVFSLGRGLTGFTLSGSSDGLSVLSGATRPGLGAGRAGFTPFVSSDLGATFSGACRSALGTGFIGVTASGFGAGTARFSGTVFPSNLGAGLPGFSVSIPPGLADGRSGCTEGRSGFAEGFTRLFLLFFRLSCSPPLDLFLLEFQF